MGCGAYDPWLHIWQAESEVLRNCPTGHWTHPVAPASDHVPARHGLHCMALVALYGLTAVLNVLRGQGTHPARVLKALPGPHTHWGSATESAVSVVPTVHRHDVLSAEGSVR